MNLTTEQKAQMYNDLLFRYQRLQEEVRLIKAQSINVSDSDQRRIDLIESEMKNVYAQTERLYR
jgi:hypothetical protein